MPMKKSHFTEEQIAYALRQAETGTAVTEVCRAMGVSEQTYYRWKKQYGGLGVQEIRRLKLLEEENRKLKQLVADLSLDKLMLQGSTGSDATIDRTAALRILGVRSPGTSTPDTRPARAGGQALKFFLRARPVATRPCCANAFGTSRRRECAMATSGYTYC